MNCDISYGTASFKGLEFEILPVENTLGQRVITHVYPFTDSHYNEELGDNPEYFKVSGAFHGEDFRDKLKVAKRLWKLRGNGVFFEPTENKNHSVLLLDVTFKYSNTKLNWVQFELNFVEKGSNPYPGLIGGIFGRINRIIDDFLIVSNNVYASVMQEISSVGDVVTGFDAAKTFVGDLSRQSVSSNFTTVSKAIGSANGVRSAESNHKAIVNIFESAADNAPISFFRQASEVRVSGNETTSVQGIAFATVALAYYFEKVADGVDYLELQSFRDRAEALKELSDNTDYINAIDTLILAAGSASTHIPTYTLPGQHNALVASYRLYGDVSKAYEILELSSGVSGASINEVIYR